MISVVVPAYNEEANIAHLYDRVLGAAASWQQPFELVVVDDGSRDRTLELLREIATKDTRVKVLSLSRNFGHQAAVTAGLRQAGGEIVAVIDADLQDPPELLGRFIAKCHEGYDVVYAIRAKRKESIFKRTAYRAYYRLLRAVANIDIPLDSGDFCVLSRRAVDALNALPERNRFVRGLRTWIGFRQVGLTYERHARASGQPKYTLRGLVNLVVNFSDRPLRVIALAGVFTALLALLAGGVFLVQYLSDTAILGYNPRNAPGWTSLILAVLWLSAMQLFALGVLGEYIGRLFEEAKRRPPFLIATAINCDGRLESDSLAQDNQAASGPQG
jgi:dolichol-phosphate mannosyltransferase